MLLNSRLKYYIFLSKLQIFNYKTYSKYLVKKALVKKTIHSIGLHEKALAVPRKSIIEEIL